MSDVDSMDDAEIRARGLDALYKALGPARTHKFLAMFHVFANSILTRLFKETPIRF